MWNVYFFGSLEFIIVLFVETPRKFITAKLSIRKPGSSSVLIIFDEDPGLRIESFAVINLCGVSTNKTIIYIIAMQTYKELISLEFVDKWIEIRNILVNFKLHCALLHITLLFYSV